MDGSKGEYSDFFLIVRFSWLSKNGHDKDVLFKMTQDVQN